MHVKGIIFIHFSNDEKQKYIVYEDALLSLFSQCYQCKSHDVSVTKLVIGSFLRLKQKCLSCETQTSWDSQPFVTNIPEGNLLISAAILFNGCLAQQGLRRLVVPVSVQDLTFTINANIFILLFVKFGI